MRIYLEPSALFKAYWPEKGSENMEWILHQLSDKTQGITSCWTILEICRGFLKRRNLGEITDDEVEDLIGFFLSDLTRLETEGKLWVEEIARSIISEGLMIERRHDLYAADSIHCATAIKADVDFMLVDDVHYKKLYGVATLKLLDVTMGQEALKETLLGRV